MNYLCFITSDIFALFGIIMIIILLLLKIGDKISSFLSTSRALQIEETPKERTIRILGSDLYNSQIEILKRVTDKHKNDNSCCALITTCHGVSVNAQKISSKLLPGDKIELNRNKNKDLIRIEKNGICIGHVISLDYKEIDLIMKNYNITGAYIHEQNTYNIFPKKDFAIKIIVYYNSYIHNESQ